MKKTPQTLLTDQDIRDWEREREELEREIKALYQRRDEINLRLRAAFLLSGRISEVGAVVKQPSLINAILFTLRGGEPLTSAQIKASLRKMGVDNPALEGGYFYRLIARAQKNGKIVKIEDKFTLSRVRTEKLNVPNTSSEISKE